MKKKKRTRKQILYQAYERDLKKISASRKFFNKKFQDIPTLHRLCNGVIYGLEIGLRMELNYKRNKTA